MAITPRDLDVDFAQVPRHWHSNSVIATGLSNGLNMLFPHGERFFVRSVNYFLDQIDDPELRAQIKGFFKQEGSHAREHDRFNAILRAQGYEIDRFLTQYQRISTWIEKRMPPKINLAITAASEHFTALFAEGAFSQNELDNLDERMRALLAWHAAEEIEHKSVAYDVLQKIDPSYALRVTGLALATVMLGGFWMWGSIAMLRQDGMTLRRFIREIRATPEDKRDPVIRRVFVNGIRQYLRRDFHPSQNPNDQLAAEWFAARGMSLPEAA
jgi:predicted metal-dependent hydrolase